VTLDAGLTKNHLLDMALATHYDIYEFYDAKQGTNTGCNRALCTPGLGSGSQGRALVQIPKRSDTHSFYALHASEVVVPRGRRHGQDGISQHVDQVIWSWFWSLRGVFGAYTCFFGKL
jgi:hypothetical protein